LTDGQGCTRDFRSRISITSVTSPFKSRPSRSSKSLSVSCPGRFYPAPSPHHSGEPVWGCAETSASHRPGQVVLALTRAAYLSSAP
jgi:hypothetical protein